MWLLKLGGLGVIGMQLNIYGYPYFTFYLEEIFCALDAILIKYIRYMSKGL